MHLGDLRNLNKIIYVRNNRYTNLRRTIKYCQARIYLPNPLT